MFIKLTGFHDNNPLWVKVDVMIALTKVVNNPDCIDHTGIVVAVDKPAIGVTETPEQILEMIKNAGN